MHYYWIIFRHPDAVAVCILITSQKDCFDEYIALLPPIVTVDIRRYPTLWSQPPEDKRSEQENKNGPEATHQWLCRLLSQPRTMGTTEVKGSVKRSNSVHRSVHSTVWVGLKLWFPLWWTLHTCSQLSSWQGKRQLEVWRLQFGQNFLLFSCPCLGDFAQVSPLRILHV